MAEPTKAELEAKAAKEAAEAVAAQKVADKEAKEAKEAKAKADAAQGDVCSNCGSENIEERDSGLVVCGECQHIDRSGLED